MNLAFVCVGAGRGERFGGDKLAEKIGLHTVFGHSIAALLEACPEVPVIAVVAPERLEEWRDRGSSDFPGIQIIAGGVRRQDSVRLGVEVASADGADVVAVHDAARPLVDPKDVNRVIQALGRADGAILSAEIPDTVKRVRADGLVAETVDRRNLRLALTPQVFRIASLEAAWEMRGNDGEWTDESALLESVGMRVHTVAARFPNPKITTKSDIEVIRKLEGLMS